MLTARDAGVSGMARTLQFAIVAVFASSLGTACRSTPPPSSPPSSEATPTAEPALARLTIDQLQWADDPAVRSELPGLLDGESVLLAHVEEWQGFDALKDFTRDCDPHFVLRAGDQEIPLRAGTGGVTSGSGSIRFVVFHPQSVRRALEPDVSYALVPRNRAVDRLWVVREDVRISRP